LTHSCDAGGDKGPSKFF